MNQCVMCGAQIAQGIVCEKCDKPRAKKTAPSVPAVENAASKSPEPLPQAAPPVQPVMAPPAAPQTPAKTPPPTAPKAP